MEICVRVGVRGGRETVWRTVTPRWEMVVAWTRVLTVRVRIWTQQQSGQNLLMDRTRGAGRAWSRGIPGLRQLCEWDYYTWGWGGAGWGARAETSVWGTRSLRQPLNDRVEMPIMSDHLSWFILSATWLDVVVIFGSIPILLLLWTYFFRWD